MAVLPTQRTLAECRKRGWICGVVERWIPQTMRRLDFLGFIDLIALDGQPGVLGIQATSRSNVSSRVAKIRASEHLAAWLAAGNRIQVWAWGKMAKRVNGRLWQCRVVPVTL